MPDVLHPCRPPAADRRYALECGPQCGHSCMQGLGCGPGPSSGAWYHGRKQYAADWSCFLTHSLRPRVREATFTPYCPTGQVQGHSLGSSSPSTFPHLSTNTIIEIPASYPPKTLAPSTFPRLHHWSCSPSPDRLCPLCGLSPHPQTSPSSQQLLLPLQTPYGFASSLSPPQPLSPQNRRGDAAARSTRAPVMTLNGCCHLTLLLLFSAFVFSPHTFPHCRSPPPPPHIIKSWMMETGLTHTFLPPAQHWHLPAWSSESTPWF